jgi:hypothetical protein
MLTGRFYIVKHLQTSNVLIGTDLIFNYRIHLTPSTDRWEWSVTVGDPNCIYAKVPCLITQKVSIFDYDMNTLVCHKVQLGDFDPDLLESSLEPGYLCPLSTDPEPEPPDPDPPEKKEDELDIINKNPAIPDHCKKKLIDCLQKIPKLYSESSFIPDPFPPELYTHDVEFTSDLTELKSRPYPFAGIRLEQMKIAVDDMCKRGILKPSDSPYCSPCFIINKKIDAGKTANSGRLVVDYRRLNSVIKPLQTPLNVPQDIFDKLSKYSSRYF